MQDGAVLAGGFLVSPACLLPLCLCTCPPAPPARRLPCPPGDGAPAPQGAAAWTQASEACRGARSLSAELRITGHAGPQKLRSATLHGAVTSEDQIYFEMPVPFGAPGFVLAGTGDRATLLLPRDKRVLHARADDIVEALVGLKLGPEQLLAMLAGCVDQSPADFGAGSLRRAARRDDADRARVSPA